MQIYTRTGDEGGTGLFHGGRVAKDHTGPEAYGTVDEAVSALGVARSGVSGELAGILLDLQRNLFVVGAELATSRKNRSKLQEGVSRVTTEMVEETEAAIDRVVEEIGMPTEFVVPGDQREAANLDHARSILRRAERRAVAHLRGEGISDSLVVPYLNRLADYLYMLARSLDRSWTSSHREE